MAGPMNRTNVGIRAIYSSDQVCNIGKFCFDGLIVCVALMHDGNSKLYKRANPVLLKTWRG